MNKLLLFILSVAICHGLTAQCGQSKSSHKSNYKQKTVTESRKGKTVTYIYSYKKGPTTPDKKRRDERHTHRPDRKRNERSYRNQKDRLMLALGAGPNYTLTPDPSTNGLPKGDETQNTFDWNKDLLRPQGNAFIGYRFNQKGHKRANVVGVWGNMGFHSDFTLGRIMAQQEKLNQLALTGGSQHFTELEGGFMLREWFRISGGIGNQQFMDINGQAQNLRYNIATLGINLPLTRTLSWNSSFSVLFGQDFTTHSFRPSTGLGLRFNMLRI